MVSFKATFLPWMLTNDGEPVIERIEETKLLLPAPPEEPKVLTPGVALKDDVTKRRRGRDESRYRRRQRDDIKRKQENARKTRYRRRQDDDIKVYPVPLPDEEVVTLIELQ